MKITIIGPGAMGCLLAAFFSRGRQEIRLLDKNPKRAQIIRQQGIKVEGISGNWQAKVNVSSEVGGICPQDLLIVTVKAYNTKEAIAGIKPLLGRDTLILTLQNGLGNVEIIAEVFGQDRVLGGITNLGATLLSDGHIRHAGKGETVIGRLDGKIPVQLRSIRETFNKAAIETRISKDIRSLLWSKLIINTGINALTAITRLNNGRLVEFESSRKLLEEAVNEAIKVAKKKRIKLIYDDPLSKVEAVCEATSLNVSSMLQDVLKSRRTEIDFINGAVVRQAQGIGVRVPVNTALTNLVKTIEASYSLKVEKI